MKHEYRKLNIWKDARELNIMIYQITNGFPNNESYGLASQLKRASISIASNIAEGSAYESNKMFLKYLNIAIGSLCETETQLYLANDVKFITNENLTELINKTDKLKRMIISFSNKLK